MSRSGLFVGIGVSTYDEHPELPEATRELTELHQLLAGELDGEPLLNPGANEVWAHLKELPELSGGGTLVLFWSGHAVVSASGELRLLTRDSEDRPRSGLPAAEVVLQCLRGDVSQLLVIVDTCFSGAAADLGAQVAAEILQESQNAAKVWVGVLASCQSFETARDGAFGHHLIELIRTGPADPALRRAWSVHNRWLKGDDVGNAVLEGWSDGAGQRPVFKREGLSGPVLPNPRYQEAARPQVVEHLLLAARAGGDGARSWFTGRREEVDAVVGWVLSGTAGVRVVTGSAGTGKSAITGRVVSAATSGERARLLEQGDLEHLDPGEGAVDAHAHLRGLTGDQVAEELDRQLVARGVLPRAGRKRGAIRLIAALERAQPATAPVLVLDGLDEAGDHAFPIAHDLLAPLGKSAIVVVSTRDRPPDASAGPGAHEPRTSGTHVTSSTDSLVESLQPLTVLDLDEPRSLESSRRARFEYVRARLSSRPVGPHDDVVMDPYAVATFVVDEAPSDEPFLVARLLVDQLLARPVDTRDPNWRAQLRMSIDVALQSELDALPVPGHRALPEGMSAAEFGRILLTALTWGLGAGFPEPEWAAVATELVADACRRAGVAAPAVVDEHDVTWVLSHLGRFLVEDGEFDTAVYRVAHQSLADHLRGAFTATPEQPFDPDAGAVALALLRRYRTLLEGGVAAAGAQYLFRYAWYHAGLAGPVGIEQLKAVAAVDPELRYDVGLTAEMVAGLLGDQESWADAAACYETAVAHLRDLDLTIPLHAQHLGDSLGNLGRCRWFLDEPEAALLATTEAAQVFTTLADTDPAYTQHAAMSAFNLSIYMGAVDRLEESVAAAMVAEYRYRELAATDEAMLPELVDGLVQLVQRLEAVGRPAQALAVRRRLGHVLGDVAVHEPARRDELARLAFELGTDDGPVPDEERVMWLSGSVDLYRTLAEEALDCTYELAQSLHFLASMLIEDELDAAIASAGEATSLLAGLARQSGGDMLAPWCLAAVQLADALSTAERHEEAAHAAAEARQAYQRLDTEAAAQIDLAPTLRTLTISLAALGRLTEACAAGDDLVAMLDLPDADPRTRSRLGLALGAQAGWLAQADRPEEAAEHARRAIEVMLDLAEEDPAILVDISRAWRILADCTAGSPNGDGAVRNVWDRAAQSLAPPARARLQAFRALEEPDGVAAVRLLAEAVPVLDEAVPDARADRARAHQEVRRRVAERAGDAAAAWASATGEELPSWARLEPASLETAGTWAYAPTRRTELESLRLHPEILSPEYDDAAAESLLGLDEPTAALLRGLRAQAMRVGAEEAYREAVVAEVAGRVSVAGLTELRELLVDQASVDLPAVRAALLDAGPQLADEAALVALAETPEGRDLIVRLAEAVEIPGAIEELVWSAAATDLSTMPAAAQVLVTVSAPGPNRAIGLMFRAVASLLAEPEDGLSPDALPESVADDVASAMLDNPALASHWISDLANRVGAHPRLVALIAHLSGTWE